MAAIRRLGIDTVELTHPLGEVRIRRLYDDVVMLGHLAVSMAAPVETAAHLAQHGEPVHAVLIVAIDRLAPVTARGDVVEPAAELDAEGSAYYYFVRLIRPVRRNNADRARACQIKPLRSECYIYWRQAISKTRFRIW
jgi:hypothetical protein